MKVCLRNTSTGLYYAGSNQWVVEPSRALDLEDIERASRLAFERDVTEEEVVLSYDSPTCNLSLPVRPEWHGDRTERIAA